MSDDARALLCLIQGDSAVFEVSVPKEKRVLRLQKLIWEERKNGVLHSVDAADLVLWKVNTSTVQHNAVADHLESSKIRWSLNRLALFSNVFSR